MNPETVIIVIHPQRDLSIPNAATSTITGYQSGFLQAGLDIYLCRADKLRGVLQEHDPETTLVFMDYDNFNYISSTKFLRPYHNVVQVNVMFQEMILVHERFNAPNPGLQPGVFERLLHSEPDFVWCSAPECYIDKFYQWDEFDLKVVSLPWACDMSRFYPTYDDENKYNDIRVAFVGGYRPYKMDQYERYLLRWGDDLVTYGYNEWPRKFNYRGQIQWGKLASLYRQAWLCPTLNEPQFVVTGDTVERPFQIMGSGGLTIIDCQPQYKQLFDDDELLMPETMNEYNDMVVSLVDDPDLALIYRSNGLKAIFKRHTYTHRVGTIVKELSYV